MKPKQLYYGQYNWQNEIHTMWTQAGSSAIAHRYFIAKLTKLLGISDYRLRCYFNEYKDNFKIKKRGEIKMHKEMGRKLIVEFLKNEPGARLTYYRQWMIWDKDDNYWKVYKEGPKGIGRIVIETTDEEKAIAKLIY